jgi:citrate synthase
MHFNPGLEGVVVATTEISYIDGKEGRLVYRGYNIKDLMPATFEEVVHLLWYGELPNAASLAKLKSSLAESRQLPGDIIELIRRLPTTAAPMEVLRTIVSALSAYDMEANVVSDEANERKAIRLTSKIASIVAAFHRIREGKELIVPDPALGHAANFLYMMTGERPDEATARALEKCLILHADHEMNASTFAARVTASTLSDLYSATTTAVGTIKGPLHGGATEAVMRMLLEIGEQPADVWVRDALKQRKRIPGFGHRIYTSEDPRAGHLREISAELSHNRDIHTWYEMSRTIEDVMDKEKGLFPNVDFYSASSYYLMGIPVDLFVPIFAISRIAGWTAHVFEQWAQNRLIRPEGEYIGPMRRTFRPLAERG